MKLNIGIAALGLAVLSQSAQTISTKDCLSIVEKSLTSRGLQTNTDYSASIINEQISINCHNYYAYRITSNIANIINLKSQSSKNPCQILVSDKNSIAPDFLDELSKELFGN